MIEPIIFMQPYDPIRLLGESPIRGWNSFTIINGFTCEYDDGEEDITDTEINDEENEQNQYVNAA